MRPILLLVLCFLAVQFAGAQNHAITTTAPPAGEFPVKGVVQSLGSDGKTIIIRHEAVPGYMSAMTMPFKAARPDDLAALHPGDVVSFTLHVTESESWVDSFKKLGSEPMVASPDLIVAAPAPSHPGHPLKDYPFTDELGRPVRLNDFRGQALAITFFFTRCPIPEYCPRLSKNFEEASHILASMPGAGTNWHFLSVSFDPEFDTPSTLKSYGERYHYDPVHWSFLTGPKDKIRQLAALSGVEVNGDGGLLTHNFRTLIIDTSGNLQKVFPFGGDLSDVIVREMLQASGSTNMVALLGQKGATNSLTPMIGLKPGEVRGASPE